MPPLLILALIGVSLLLGPAAFILLWLAKRRTNEESLGLLAMSILGLCLVMLGNCATLITESFLGLRDARIAFLIMNWVFLSTVMSSGFGALFACSCARSPASGRLKVLFWSFSAAFFFLVISLPIFIGPPKRFDMSEGYLASTCYGAIVQIWSTAKILRSRVRHPVIYGRVLPPLAVAVLILELASVANDAFRIGPLLGGAMLPFSPFFFMLVTGCVIALCVHVLAAGADLPGEGARSAADPEACLVPLGLSEREREVLPLLLESLSNEEIAERLFISPHTVKNHVTAIFRKAGVANRYELLARAGGDRGGRF